MKRDYIVNEFDEDLKSTVALLKDKNISLEARYDIAEDFCSVYVYFDSSRFDKFF